MPLNSPRTADRPREEEEGGLAGSPLSPSEPIWLLITNSNRSHSAVVQPARASLHLYEIIQLLPSSSSSSRPPAAFLPSFSSKARNHRHPLVPFHPDDLIPHGLDVLEALLVHQAVDQDETLPVFDIQVSHGGELLGPRRVQDLQDGRRGVHLDLLPVEILYRGVVFLYEGSRHELDG
ncbi:hypothetical protein INR49_003407 [Caranx melampygus]|nr:hypothetical protein INR49_003407 [Caranx melampygus]